LAITLELPHVGESVVEGTIGKWLKQPGDKIDRFEPLVEVVTDKVTMEVPSPVDGSLLRVLAQEGETVPMGAPIAELETADDAAGTAPAPEPPTRVSAPPPATPEVVGITGYLVKDVKPVGPTGGGAEEEAIPEAPSQTTKVPRGASRLSPAVRRLAAEHSIDLDRVPGTGMGGRITRDDVLRFLEEDKGAAVSVTTARAPQSSEPRTHEETITDEEHVPLTAIRRIIADNMVRSVSQIPHAWSTVEADVTNMVALRSQVRTSFEEKEGVELTYLPFMIKAVVESLKQHPSLNASWGGYKIILKKRINLGIAVATAEGLFVPVIHDADRLSIAGLAVVTRDLTLRARQQKLTLDDVQGGTFTLNNTGALGSTVSQPIINFPQAAILTTEVIQKRPVVRDDAIAIRSMMNLCISFDHRINDGSESSGFLQSVKSRLESIGPDTPLY
jgi:2-oxoisovalerate dehydrogenase E2 component (dihydrolipoyl transacylase)